MREFVADVGDPRLADYARLTDMELRTSLESGQGLFIAEGTKVISRAVAAGYRVRSVLLAECRLGDLVALPAAGVPVYVVPDGTAERLTGYRVHRGALASLYRRPLPRAAAAGRCRPPGDRARGPRRPRERRGHLPVRRRARRGCCIPVTAVRRSALPAGGEGFHGRGVCRPLRPDGRLVRRPGRAAGGRVPAARADAGPGGCADRRGRGCRGPRFCSAPRVMACRPAGCTRPIRSSASRCIRAPWPPGSTRSMWSPPPRSHATCSWARTSRVRASHEEFRRDPGPPEAGLTHTRRAVASYAEPARPRTRRCRAGSGRLGNAAGGAGLGPGVYSVPVASAKISSAIW